VDGTRGTIFIMAHGREEAFDADDVRMMQMLADFAAMGFRHQRQQKKLIEQERASAAAAMANQLAHQINNPLQSLTNVVYLAAHGQAGEAKALGNSLAADVQRLSGLVNQLLALPVSGRPQ
jgi:nitrogen-specific signal transduction histidine kinase